MPIASLFVFITRFELMSNGKDQHRILGSQPAIFGYVAKLAARQDQLPAPVLRFAAQQRMVCKQLEGSPNADHPLTRELRIVVCEKIEKPLEIGERSSRYLDARHARARGRRTDFPAARASR